MGGVTSTEFEDPGATNEVNVNEAYKDLWVRHAHPEDRVITIIPAEDDTKSSDDGELGGKGGTILVTEVDWRANDAQNMGVQTKAYYCGGPDQSLGL